MSDLHFYNVGCHEPRGLRRAVIPVRRALRRVLRPIFLRQVQIFQSLCDRLDAAERADQELQAQIDGLARRQSQLADQLQATAAFGWDYVAMVRRLAALEDRVEALTARSEGDSQDRMATTEREAA
ncbi:MAG: hypothetical protein IRY99_09910 [Isosphaeraceae bacterium]|nr:hypothetical protein [Isosphaeraceae bacterium]